VGELTGAPYSVEHVRRSRRVGLEHVDSDVAFQQLVGASPQRTAGTERQQLVKPISLIHTRSRCYGYVGGGCDGHGDLPSIAAANRPMT
jgi:hypothetical protein